jgi:hypothetical protein
MRVFGLAGEAGPHDQKGDEGRPVGAECDKERGHWANPSNVGSEARSPTVLPAYGVTAESAMGFSDYSRISRGLVVTASRALLLGEPAARRTRSSAEARFGIRTGLAAEVAARDRDRPD